MYAVGLFEKFEKPFSPQVFTCWVSAKTLAGLQFGFPLLRMAVLQPNRVSLPEKLSQESLGSERIMLGTNVDGTGVSTNSASTNAPHADTRKTIDV
jgi:hypothetical protein